MNVADHRERLLSQAAILQSLIDKQFAQLGADLSKSETLVSHWALEPLRLIELARQLQRDITEELGGT